MKKLIIFSLSLIISLFNICYSQRFIPPTPGKSVVCIACIDNETYGELYHNDKYIGKINAASYIIYEFEPGNHLIWTEIARKTAGGYFIEADLEKDKTYLLIASAKASWAASFMDYRLRLTPFDITDTLVYKRVKRLLKYVEPKATAQKDIDKKNKKNSAFIERKLSQYHTWNEKGKDKPKYIGILSSDQYIPIEVLNNL